ncbi:MAG: hypothetical protein ACRBN8_38950 [Nannocystales bacterium]
MARDRVMTVCPCRAELDQKTSGERGLELCAATTVSDARSAAHRPRVQRPPSQRLAHAVRLVLGRRTFDRVLGPTMADVYLEWVEAHSSGDLVEAKRVRIRSAFCLSWAAVAYLLGRVAVVMDDFRKNFGPKR